MKPKLICILIIAFLAIKPVTAQTITINEYIGNRPLIWEDFRGKPEVSPFDAKTFWNINYKYTYQTIGDSIKVTPTVALELGALSWAKQNRLTDDLLKHEQGHFNVGLLCAKELANTLQSKVYPKQYFAEYIKRSFAEIMEKYKTLEKKYDAETDHSKNKKEQEKWNTFFKTNLK